MSISVGDVLLTLGLDTDDFQGQINGINQQAEAAAKGVSESLGAIGKAALVVGGAITGAGALSIKAWSDMGESILLMSQKTGMSTTSLSEWKYVAEQSGTSLDALGTAFRIMAQGITNASKENTETFAKLGLSIKDLQAMKPEDQFNAIMEALSGIEDPTEKAALSMAVFGRSGTELIPILAGGKDGIDEMKNKAHELGVVMGTDAASQAEAFGDAINDTKQVALGFMGTISSIVMPVLKPLIDMFVSGASHVREFAENHKTLTGIIVGVTGVLGLLLLGFGTYVTLSTSATVQTIAHTVAKIAHTAAMIAWQTVLFLCTAAQYGLNAAMTANPIGAVVVAITALIAVGVLLYKNWDTVVQFFKQGWESIKIAFVTAVDFLMNTVLLPWVLGIEKIISPIIGAIGKLVGIFNKDAGAAIQGVADTLGNLRGKTDEWKTSVIAGAEEQKKANDVSYAAANAQKEAADSTGKAKTATDDHTAALGSNTGALGANAIASGTLQEALDKTTQSVKDQAAALEYSTTAAGKAGMTEKDLTDVLLKMGMTVDQVSAFLVQEHVAGKNVDQMLADLGLTMGDVNKIQSSFGLEVKRSKEAIDLETQALANKNTILKQTMLQELANIEATKALTKANQEFVVSQGVANAFNSTNMGAAVAGMTPEQIRSNYAGILPPEVIEGLIGQAANYGNNGSAANDAASAAANAAWWNSLTPEQKAAWEQSQYDQANIPTDAYGNVIAYANGGQAFADKPTLALFGEAGPELATFTPVRGVSGSAMSGGGSRMTIIFNGAIVKEDFDVDVIGGKIADTIRLRTGYRG